MKGGRNTLIPIICSVSVPVVPYFGFVKAEDRYSTMSLPSTHWRLRKGKGKAYEYTIDMLGMIRNVPPSDR